MKFFVPTLIWVVMGAVLAASIVGAIAGHPVWLILGVVGFFVLAGATGYATH